MYNFIKIILVSTYILKCVKIFYNKVLCYIHQNKIKKGAYKYDLRKSCIYVSRM